MTNNLKTRGHLLTEQVNVNSANLDRLSSIEIVDLFNKEDLNTIDAIAGARGEIANAIDLIADSLRQGGRLFYIGAGTSGRLGVLDAAECPPTFCTPPELVQGILAGGAGALVKSSEGLEDIASDGAKAMADNHIGEHDVVVGIAAGGTTPYVHGAIESADPVRCRMFCAPLCSAIAFTRANSASSCAVAGSAVSVVA